MDPVTVCNLAIVGQLGGNRIAALDEVSREAELCADAYPAMRDAVLEARAWTFATEWSQVAKNAVAPTSPLHLARFGLPATLLRVLEVTDEQGRPYNYVRAGGYVLTEEDPDTVRIRAIHRVEDCTLWSPGYTQALVLRLSAELAIPLTQNRGLADALEVKYQERLYRAGTLDGMQGTSEKRTASFLSSRRY